MRSKLLRAPAWGTAHSDLVERRFQRYCPRFQGAVRALAMRHSRIADLAVSFPALLFALAAPRAGLDPTRALDLAVETSLRYVRKFGSVQRDQFIIRKRGVMLAETFGVDRHGARL